MQCFQKDPNLRVSARKLLKHPWIVNARRSDSVVPKKPTEYEEAVKTVQQWNEALKSPTAGSLRKTSRPMSSSPVPGRGSPSVLATPAKGALHIARPRATAEQFRSPDNTGDDNWDADFASAISPSALQLPHLRPHDNFNGMLSAEKLKAYASFETVTEEENWDDNFEGELTVRSPMKVAEPDPMQTVRLYKSSKAADSHPKRASPKKPGEWKRTPPVNQRALPRQPQRAESKLVKPQRPTVVYKENTIEDYPNVITNNDAVLERKLKVEIPGFIPELVHVDIPSRTMTRCHRSSSILRTFRACHGTCNLRNSAVVLGDFRFPDSLRCGVRDLPLRSRGMPRANRTKTSPMSSVQAKQYLMGRRAIKALMAVPSCFNPSSRIVHGYASHSLPVTLLKAFSLVMMTMMTTTLSLSWRKGLMRWVGLWQPSVGTN